MELFHQSSVGYIDLSSTSTEYDSHNGSVSVSSNGSLMFTAGGDKDTIRQLIMEIDRSVSTYTSHFSIYRIRSIVGWKRLEDWIVLEYHQRVMGLGIHRQGSML